MRNSIFKVILIVNSMMLISLQYAYAGEYNLLDISWFNDMRFVISPYAINDKAQITGYFVPNENIPVYHAFRTIDWKVYDIGNIGKNSIGNDINNSGEVAGDIWMNDNTFHAFTTSNGIMEDIGTLGGISTYAKGINSSGDIVGQMYISDGNSHAFMTINGTVQDVYNLFDKAVLISGINNSGDVIGLNKNGTFRTINGITDNLGNIGYPTALNTNGVVTGWLPNGHSYIATNGLVTDIGTLGGGQSHSFAINNNGDVVGIASDPLNLSAYRGFIYTENTMIDLNCLIVNNPNKLFFNEAYDINNLGQILATGIDRQGGSHTVILSPVGVPTPNLPTPEPSTFLLFGAGLGGLALLRRKARK